MTATASHARRGAPGSRPPIRGVTDEEVARHFPLVDYTLHRMLRRGQLGGNIDWDDRVAVGRWAVWEALRRWDPARGAQSTYLTSYIVGYAQKHQRDVTKADGWHRKHGQIATVGSYEAELVENITVLDTLAAPDDTDEQAEWATQLDDVARRLSMLRPQLRDIATRVIINEEPANTVARDHGISRARIGQYLRPLRAFLRGQGPVKRAWLDRDSRHVGGVLLIDRNTHTTSHDAIREARRLRPGCDVVSLAKRKVRRGRVVSPQGRATADGSLGRPVWAVTILEDV